MAATTSAFRLHSLPSSRPSTTSISAPRPSARLRRRAFDPRLHAKARRPSPSSEESTTSDSDNAVLRVAWYGSELLGIAASLFRPGRVEGGEQGGGEVVGGLPPGGVIIARDEVVAAIKGDFQRSYFVTGNLTLNAYNEDCEFADPAGSFKGLARFKRNCTNFGLLLIKSNMKLTKWEDSEDKGVGHWKFSCIMSFPWRPILSATGYSEYYFDPKTGKVSRHVEHWNVPKMALLKQIMRPTRWVWGGK